MVGSGWVFLDIDHPVVAWATYRGVLVSAARAADAEPGIISMMFAEMIRTSNKVRLRNEFVIESVRARHFPHQVSRLSGLFFFEDYADALRASSWGDYFNSKYLAEIGVDVEGTATRVDSQWISYAPLLRSGAIDQNKTSWIESYWKGDPYNQNPMWEMIITGRIEIFGTALREKAYDKLKVAFPEALDLLEVARIAAASDSSIGRIVPFLRGVAPDVGRLGYFVDMRQANDPEALQKIAKYAGPKNLKDLAIGKPTFGVPDLRSYETDFEWNQE